MAVPQEQTLTTSDDIKLVGRLWIPAAPPRGQILIVHGLGEHSGRYQGLAALLVERNWQVVAYDQRGHGKSGGPRGGTPTPHRMLEDIGLMLTHVRQALPSKPLILLGHSLGGLLSARYVTESLAPQPAAWSYPVDGLMLSSPALDPGMSVFQKLLTAFASRVLPGLAVSNGLDPSWVSRDAAIVQHYREDPLVHDRITGCLAGFIAEAGPEVFAAAPQWTTRTLLMWAGADRCVRPAGSEQFAALAPPACVETQVWPGLAHEIFNEPERLEVIARLQSWLDTHWAAAS